MSAFKDFVRSDVKSVFINFDEFASNHSLNGVNTLCVIDRDLTQAASSENEGVFLNNLTIYIDNLDIANRPVEGELFKVDGSFHLVKSVSDEEGILVIVCEANEQ